MHHPWAALSAILIQACVINGGDPGTGINCVSASLRDAQGDPDGCDLAACITCVDHCGVDCVIQESYPPRYSCGGDATWDVYDQCPDWKMPDYLPCDDTTTTLAPDEPTTLGFSADQVLATAAGPFQAEAEWIAEEGRVDTVITLTLAAGEAPVWHDRTAVDGGLGEAECPDLFEVPVTLTLVTADGAFDESLPSALWVTDLSALSIGAPLSWTSLGGSFEFQTLDPTEWDTVTLDLSTLLLPTFDGQVQISANRSTGPDTGEGFVGPLLRWPPQP